MAVAKGNCPNCGAAIEFSVGQSVSKVCPYCRHVVLRGDRGFENLGKAADLANTPSALSVGDRGTVRGVGFEIVGRVQLDWGKGPWDEFYAIFTNDTVGWISEAQGNLYVTTRDDEGIALPDASSLVPDQPVALGRYGTYRVVERRTARVVSAEGELPHPPGTERLYADLTGPSNGFASIDYGDGTRPPVLNLGAQIERGDLQVAPRGGERNGATKVALEAIKCPNCGGELPAPTDPSIERVACRYCHALSDLRAMQVITRQERARSIPVIPLGSKATLAGKAYTLIGYAERSASFDGERFSWHEYLLYGEGVGFRWLVEDEGNWLFTRAISSAEITTSGQTVRWHNRGYALRNQNEARVDYVLGEFYWKVEVGETVDAADYIAGSDVISREASGDEVNWSYSTPVSWNKIANAFGVEQSVWRPPPPPEPEWTSGGLNYGSSGGGSGSSASVIGWIVTIVILLVVFACIASLDNDGCSGGGYSGGGGYHYSGGGGFGGK